MGAPVRLQRYLAAGGVAARRKAEELITAGRVRVNGEVVTVLGTKVDPDADQVTVDGEAVVARDLFYVVFNKPKACITAVTDDRGRPTVMDYLPNLPVPVKPVGRLDFYTEGVLLLTNDGELAARVLAPASHVPKTYHVKVHGQLTRDDIALLRQGVQLDDGSMTQPAEVASLPGESKHTWLAITIHEGKHRQIHRMIEALGYRVDKLQRVAFANLTFHDLRIGDARELTQLELNEIRDMVGLDHSPVARGVWHSSREDTDIPRRAKAKARDEAGLSGPPDDDDDAGPRTSFGSVRPTKARGAGASFRGDAGSDDAFDDEVDDRVSGDADPGVNAGDRPQGASAEPDARPRGDRGARDARGSADPSTAFRGGSGSESSGRFRGDATQRRSTGSGGFRGGSGSESAGRFRGNAGPRGGDASERGSGASGGRSRGSVGERGSIGVRGDGSGGSAGTSGGRFRGSAGAPTGGFRGGSGSESGGRFRGNADASRGGPSGSGGGTGGRFRKDAPRGGGAGAKRSYGDRFGKAPGHDESSPGEGTRDGRFAKPRDDSRGRFAKPRDDSRGRFAKPRDDSGGRFAKPRDDSRRDDRSARPRDDSRRDDRSAKPRDEGNSRGFGGGGSRDARPRGGAGPGGGARDFGRGARGASGGTRGSGGGGSRDVGPRGGARGSSGGGTRDFGGGSRGGSRDFRGGSRGPDSGGGSSGPRAGARPGVRRPSAGSRPVRSGGSRPGKPRGQGRSVGKRGSR